MDDNLYNSIQAEIASLESQYDPWESDARRDMFFSHLGDFLSNCGVTLNEVYEESKRRMAYRYHDDVIRNMETGVGMAV